MRAKSRLLRLCLCAVLTGSVCEAQQARQTASPPPAAVLEHNLVNVGTIHPPLLQEIRYATMVITAKTKLRGLPSRVKQRIPHLTLEELAIMAALIDEALEELASGR